MEIVILDKSEYRKIAPLWQKLNQLHETLSIHFKHHFATFTFDERMAGLLVREHLAVFVAWSDTLDDNVIVGYCIVSVEKGRGEVDSIYIEPAVQGKGAGSALMNEALTWLDRHHCKDVRVSVSIGNEAVLDFYRQFGFEERLLVLQRKTIL